MSPAPLEWLRDETGRTGLDWPRVLLVALSAAVLCGLLVAATTSTAAFGPYNPSWDGTSKLHEQVSSEPGVESEFTRDTARYGEHEPSETVAIVVAPDDQYEPTDAERVRRFVDEGGTLVVLENFGANGNDLLADVGATARAEGTLLRDEREHYRGPAMPVATGVADHPLTDGVDRLTLNYASAVDPGEATVLVETSEFAYRDANRNGELDADEEPRSTPVATVESVGDGRVIVVGDPSIAINAMLDEPDNAAFLRAIYTEADAEHVLIDLSHAGDLPPLAAATLLLRDTPALQLLVGLLAVGAVAAGSRRGIRSPFSLERLGSRQGTRRSERSGRRAGRNGAGTGVGSDLELEARLDDEQRAALLRERYPEWDERRIQRVIAAFNRSDMKSEPNE